MEDLPEGLVRSLMMLGRARDRLDPRKGIVPTIWEAYPDGRAKVGVALDFQNQLGAGFKTDVDNISTQMTNLHADLGTTIHADLGTLHTDLANLLALENIFPIAGVYAGNGAPATILTAAANYRKCIITACTEDTTNNRTLTLLHVSGAVTIKYAFNFLMTPGMIPITFAGFGIKSGDTITAQSDAASKVWIGIEGS